MMVRHGPAVLAVGADGVVLTFSSPLSFHSFFLPLSERRPDIDVIYIFEWRLHQKLD